MLKRQQGRIFEGQSKDQIWKKKINFLNFPTHFMIDTYCIIYLYKYVKALDRLLG